MIAHNFGLTLVELSIVPQIQDIYTHLFTLKHGIISKYTPEEYVKLSHPGKIHTISHHTNKKQNKKHTSQTGMKLAVTAKNTANISQRILEN